MTFLSSHKTCNTYRALESRVSFTLVRIPCDSPGGPKGLIMEPERRYTQQVKKSFHISMAALDLGSSDNEASQVMCGYEGRNYLLCTLKQPDMLQCPLDLEFAAGTEVSFASNGKAHIHLTGYLTDVDGDGLNLEDLAEEEEDDEEVEEEQVEETLGKKKKNKNVEKNEPPSKKAKLLNGSATKEDEDGEEEESDDPDFEEEADSDEGDDEENGEEEEDSDEEDDEGDDAEEEEEDEEPEVPQKLNKKEKKKMKQEAEATKAPQQQQKKQRQILKGGVVIEDLVEGNGPPAKAGRFVNVFYEGRLEKNNKMFDSATKGPGFKFRLGTGEVIKAWDTGLVGMKVGGVRKIICPPQTAYGPKGSPPAIPPNSTLVFTVTLKKIN